MPILQTQMVEILETEMKNILLILFGFVIVFGTGFAIQYWQTKLPESVTEQMMAIQEQVGCESIDGVIGPETTRLVNARVEAEQEELFNGYAAQYMTPSGAPKWINAETVNGGM